jgi:hypothetical protein
VESVGRGGEMTELYEQYQDKSIEEITNYLEQNFNDDEIKLMFANMIFTMIPKERQMKMLKNLRKLFVERYGE